MPDSEGRKSVLITGCSEGGLGSALAIAFSQAGLHVYATSRSLAKMAHLSSIGVTTLELDVLSPESIATCVGKLPGLDILVNSAGGRYSMPIADMDLDRAKAAFEMNVWAPIAVVQAFLPLLLKSKGIAVNHTSSGAVVPVPFMSAFIASKAAMAMFTATMRHELAPFGVTVLEIKTGNLPPTVHTQTSGTTSSLPANSIYAPAREIVEECLRGERKPKKVSDPEQWAKEVVSDVLKPVPPPVIWRGASATLVRFAMLLPSSWTDSAIKKAGGIDEIEEILKRKEDAKTSA
jgi:1-acylglycerone phosphate reductase